VKESLRNFRDSLFVFEVHELGCVNVPSVPGFPPGFRSAYVGKSALLAVDFV
jgi:hypothetical protein